MSITRRTFLIASCVICATLLALSAASYLLLRASLTRQLITSQQALIEANVRLSSVFTQTVDQLVYQYTSDQQLGQLLSETVGEDELKDLNTRSGLNSRMAYQLNAQSILLNNNFTTQLYVNPDLEVSQLFTAENTIPNVSRVFSGEMAEEEIWYQTARQSRGGQYIFLSEDGTRLCFACKLQNSAFTGAHRKEGVGVLLGSMPVSQLPRLLSLFPVTENSGFLLLNSRDELVYRSVNLDGLPTGETLFVDDTASTELMIGGKKYLSSARELEWGVRLVFLTPYSDITAGILATMSPYLICSAVFLLVGVVLSLALAAGISRPVVQFTRRLESIQDTRGLDASSFRVKGPREIQQLNRSFGALVERINALIDQVKTTEDRRRESELRALQAQINPHFMLNAMNAVNYMALEREEDDIAATVDSIASLMRYSITEPDRLVTMSTELDNIREYISVYVLRFRQDIRLELLPGLFPSQVVIPKFTLQPLVENSIRHGITRQDPGITVYIRARQEEDRLLIEVTDTGMGADAAKLNAYLDYQPVDLKVTHGFGIRNVNERLRLRFGEESSLRYENYEGRRLLARLTICHPCTGADTP